MSPFTVLKSSDVFRSRMTKTFCSLQRRRALCPLEDAGGFVHPPQQQRRRWKSGFSVATLVHQEEEEEEEEADKRSFF